MELSCPLGDGLCPARKIWYRVCALSRNKKIKSKTIQWIKARNCNIIDDK